jgi:hypothetical protein
MRRPLIRGKNFKLPLDKEKKLKEGSWEAFERKGTNILCVLFFGGKGGK